jgi:S-adenosylmethionine:tRNA ribosyltransferase-isomerase
MTPAQIPRTNRESAKLLVINATGHTFTDARVIELPAILQPGDLLVLNDAATLPASLRGWSTSGDFIEIRLAQDLGNGLWSAVLFGRGDWRTPTELRDPPMPLWPGSTIEISNGFAAEIVQVSLVSYRLVKLRFNRTGPELWSALYAYGKPIQYSYQLNDLPLWSVQTTYAAQPWSFEMPSAGQPFTWSVFLALRRRGVKLARLTHSAGLSATGDEDLDSKLPFTERYDIPKETVDEVQQTRATGSKVIAVGTTVVRALEGSIQNNGGVLRAGTGETDLIVDRNFRLEVVNGLLTGIHDPAQSHFRLLRAFVDETTLRQAWRHATEAGYLCHEFGDLCLISRGKVARTS